MTEPVGDHDVAGLMPRSNQKPSKAKQRDAELARVEAELNEAREKLDAINAEIRRSGRLLAALKSPDIDASPFPDQFDGAIATYPFREHRNGMPDRDG